jgi:hypothetical protein
MAVLQQKSGGGRPSRGFKSFAVTVRGHTKMTDKGAPHPFGGTKT